MSIDAQIGIGFIIGCTLVWWLPFKIIFWWERLSLRRRIRKAKRELVQMGQSTSSRRWELQQSIAAWEAEMKFL